MKLLQTQRIRKELKRPEIGALPLRSSFQVNQPRTRMDSVLLSEWRQNKGREEKLKMERGVLKRNEEILRDRLDTYEMKNGISIARIGQYNRKI